VGGRHPASDKLDMLDRRPQSLGAAKLGATPSLHSPGHPSKRLLTGGCILFKRAYRANVLKADRGRALTLLCIGAGGLSAPVTRTHALIIPTAEALLK
jgi:hypothetical protein